MEVKKHTVNRKQCSKCKEKLSLEKFSRCGKKKDGTTNYESRCKNCRNSERRLKWKATYAKQKETKKIYGDTKKCYTEGCGVWPLEKFWFKGAGRKDARCIECVKKLTNREKKNKINKDWYHHRGGKKICQDNWQKYKPIRNVRNKERRVIDINYKLKMTFRSRIYEILNNNNINKTNKHKYLGIDIPTYRLWLESQFKDGMTWKNYGSIWHIDHVMPCESFKFTSKNDDSIYKCFNWKNTRPLLVLDNLSKSCKICHKALIMQSININIFILKNDIKDKMEWYFPEKSISTFKYIKNLIFNGTLSKYMKKTAYAQIVDYVIQLCDRNKMYTIDGLHEWYLSN